MISDRNTPGACEPRHAREPSADTRGAGEPKLALDAPALALPKGGGAIRGIDEKLTTNAATGTVSLALPLPFTPARNNFVPPVQLTYNSGSGNSTVGLGWALGMPSIARRTDHLLPRYRGDDVFLHGGEELVPATRWDIDRWTPDVLEVGPYTIRRYRPRIEGGFARIEHITHAVLGTWWRVQSRDNVTTLFGVDAASRITDPAAPDHVFHWLPSTSFDDQGNCLSYVYKPEDLAAVPVTLSEANRRRGLAPFANQHLKRLRYGNRTPYVLDEADPYLPVPASGAMLFEAVFDYGEHDALAPTPNERPDQPWPARADAFSSHRGGFDLRTYRLLRRVLMFHHFDELAGGAPCLVRSLDLAHVSSAVGSPQASEVSYLQSATQCGYVRSADGSYVRRSLPPVEYSYEPLHWHAEIATVDAESAANLPAGAAGGTRWMDLYGEGIAGLFTEQAEAWFYKANLGDVDEDGQVRLDAMRPVMPRPSFTGMQRGVLELRDLHADGRNQIVVHTPQLQGYFDQNPDGGSPDGAWLPFRPFEAMVRIDLDDHHLRMLDLDGDGRADLLIAEDDAFVWYRADDRGYQPAERTVKPSDEERGPAIAFAEDHQTIFLADMSGDGLIDIVRIRNGEICYWPNLGYGRFGAKVAMDHAPWFAPPDHFHASYLHLADVSGTGASDVLYLSPHGCAAYLNLSGNAWSAAQPIAPFFPAEAPNQITTTDLLGNGTACIVWSSTLPAHARQPLRYLDLMGGKKPHLLRSYVNNLGTEVTFSYKSSTWYYLKDKLAGRPWVTRLPFPVHCLRTIETRDQIGGARQVTELTYHHGYYDRSEREFRGFGMVEQRDAESFEHWAADAGHVVDRTLYQTPVLSKTWFHTGAVADRAAILTRFRDEYWDRELARQGFAVAVDEPALPDARLVPGPGVDPAVLAPISAEDWREALRACKGMVLRKEVFGLDAPVDATPAERQRALSPYTVATHNCVIELLQPVQPGSHAVFVVKESEAVTWCYERQPGDPRIEHKLNLAVDAYGNVLEAAAIVYGRATPDLALRAAVRDAQARTSITYTHHELTDDAISAAHHRLRQASRTTTFELRGLPRTGALYQVADFTRPAFHVLSDSVELPFHEPDGAPGAITRRPIQCKQTVFYDEALAGALPLHALHHRALVFESYELAFTPALLGAVFTGRASDDVMGEAGYVHRDDTAWWVPSGRLEYLAGGLNLADAHARFFAPTSHLDARGARTSVGYFAGYFLLRDVVEDAAHNRTTIDAFDLRTLAAIQMTDPNGNISEAVLDELGWVKASALRGKGDEGDALTGLASAPGAAEAAAHDAFLAAASSVELEAAARTLLGRATTRYIYDPHRYVRTGEPPMSATILREQHAAVQLDAALQMSFEYANGAGKIELRKVQAEPGPALRVTLLAGDGYTVDVVDTAVLAPPRLRWLGTGKRVLNNKGNAVKEYEPFFSITHRFESQRELIAAGMTRVQTYDPIDRVVRIDHPDATFSRTELTAWTTTAHDRNDTVLDAPWYQRRVDRLIDAQLIADGKDPAREAQAAAQTAAHAGTPRVSQLDPSGRAILDVEDDGRDGDGQPLRYPTIRTRDISGHVQAIDDARDHTTIRYERDLRGRTVAHASLDGGQRWMLDDVRGEPVRSWDERGHEFVFGYDDALHRPTSKRVRGGDGPVALDHVFERTIYGEDRPGDVAHNLRGRVAVSYDTAGRSEHVAFDFQGNLTASTRRLARDAKAIPRWDVADPDAALLAESFASSGRYDALGRVAERTTADGSVYAPIYNAANLLDQVRITQGAISELQVTNIDYDEQGQRRRIAYGNGVTTSYRYDRETFRLLALVTQAGARVLQDLHYTYDPAGNITHLEDRAVPTVWFDNQVVTGLATYRYAPSYRLIEATGREHAAQVDFGLTDNWSDGAFVQRAAAGDPLVWRNYTQRYQYDAVGNLTELAHVAAGASWTRAYRYAADSNRLATTQIGASELRYRHHPAHGYLTSMPHLTVMQWSFRDELRAVSTQAVNAGTPETTWYVYDGGGKRVRKITERAAAEGALPARKFERIYLDGVEIYREYAGDDVALERRSLDVMDDRQRITLIESEGATRVVRYQSADQLQSAHLETDSDGRVISYEEYHPFGTTAYQATDAATTAAAKRYRFTGMERDDESGLAYHGARYYAPWLGRWTAPDSHPDMLDGNRYAYVKNNPIIQRDPGGKFEEPAHGVLTYRLAIAAGIPPGDAARIAIATAAMDHDPQTMPAGPGDILAFRRIPQTIEFHYPTGGFSAALAPVQRDIADQRAGVRRSDDLERFGRHLHTLEDVGFVEAPGPHMRRDDGRPVQRIVGPTAGLFGMAFFSGGLIALTASIRSTSTGGQVAGIIVSLVLLVGPGIYLIALGIATSDIGHPSYKTQRGADSHSFAHTADQLPQDPGRNSDEMWRVYGQLQAYARARYGNVATNDDAARAAIAQGVAADNSCLVSNFANAPAVGPGGVTLPSYSSILSSRTADRGRSWLPQDMDVTNPAGRGPWSDGPRRFYTPGVNVCPR